MQRPHPSEEEPTGDQGSSRTLSVAHDHTPPRSTIIITLITDDQAAEPTALLGGRSSLYLAANLLLFARTKTCASFG
jgi:hypothetical protein